MPERRFLAFDLGAESGRAVVGRLGNGRLTLEEIHRFSNEPAEVLGTLYWDVLNLYNNILKGIRAYVARFGDSVDGIGIDTWGLDFGLFGKDGALLQNPVCYRDVRTHGMLEQVLKRVPAHELYRRSGLPTSQIHTLFQLFAVRQSDTTRLDVADTFLMMPDILAYFLTGEKRCERTNAISTQLYDPRKGTWSQAIFKACDLPISVTPRLINPGTVLGEVSDSVKRETGLKHGQVIAPCTHDTASAVAAVPGEGKNWAFVSCGTWSVVGALTEKVITTPAAREGRLCNELTLGSFFLCRNIMGLWLLQRARAVWQRRGKEYSYAKLAEMAVTAKPGGPLVNPDDARFLAPDDMEAAIGDYCRATGQMPPGSAAETTRSILESLAFSYRRTLDRIAEIRGGRFKTLHVVGGGSQNVFLCQTTANVTGIPVVAGPMEATAIGNILVQAVACGHIGSARQIRNVVRDSTELIRYTPQDRSRWEKRNADYRSVCESPAR